MAGVVDQLSIALDIVRLRAVKRRIRTFSIVSQRRQLTAHEAQTFTSLIRERADIVARLTTDRPKGGE